ncbi:hypothetical protein [Helicobacter pylori]
MKKQILTGVLLSVLAVSSAYLSSLMALTQKSVFKNAFLDTIL